MGSISESIRHLYWSLHLTKRATSGTQYNKIKLGSRRRSGDCSIFSSPIYRWFVRADEMMPNNSFKPTPLRGAA